MGTARPARTTLRVRDRCRFAARRGASVRLVVCALAVVVASACGEADVSSDSPSPPGSSTWGPLAVIDEDSFATMQAHGGAGTLIFRDDCVSIRDEESLSQITLVWRNSQVTWDERSRTIIFDDPTQGRLRLREGDRVRIGGRGIPRPLSAEATGSGPRWIVLPGPTCPSEAFAVHEVHGLD